MDTWAAYVSEYAGVVSAVLGAIGGLWAAARRLRSLLRSEIQDYAASKEDVARIEMKTDLLLDVLLERPRDRKASLQ